MHTAGEMWPSTSVLTHVSGGVTTNIGNVQEVCWLVANNAPIRYFCTGTMQIKTLNGNVYNSFLSYQGWNENQAGTQVGTYVITGGTNRFAKAKGQINAQWNTGNGVARHTFDFQ